MRHGKIDNQQLFLNRIDGGSRPESPEAGPENLPVGDGNHDFGFDPDEKWLTTEEAAEYLRTSPGTLRNMVCNGTLRPSGKFGRRNRFLVSDLRELLLAKR